MATFQEGHALVIGVGTYQDAVWNAPATAADAADFADTLKDPAVSGYPPEQVELLHDSHATREGVVAALRRLAQHAAADDTAVVFFCGHGVLGDDGLYYFTTHDTSFTPSKKAKAGTGLSAPDILDLLRAIKARRLLFIINACFSGHLCPTLGQGDAPASPPSSTLGIQVLDTGEGRVIITASRPSQFSFYRPEQKHTYFGQALLDGLRGEGVKDSGGYVGLYELYQYLYTQVKAASGGAQDPVLTILQGVGPFPLALYPGAAPDTLGKSPIQQTPPAGTAVNVVEPAVAQAVGKGALAIAVQGSSSLKIDQDCNVIGFGSGNTVRDVTIGNVAGRDMITITMTAAAAANVDDDHALLKAIDDLRDDVAKLSDVPRGRRQDANDELRKAREAGEEGDRLRLLEKLELAQSFLQPLGASNPAALKVADTVGVLLQRAVELRGLQRRR